MQVIIDYDEYQELLKLKEEETNHFKQALKKLFDGEVGFITIEGRATGGVDTYQIVGKEQWMKFNGNFRIKQAKQ